MRDTLSTNGEYLRVDEVKSFPAIPKSMRSVNGYRNGAKLKKVVSLADLHHTTVLLYGKILAISQKCGRDFFLHLPDEKERETKVLASVVSIEAHLSRLMWETLV